MVSNYVSVVGFQLFSTSFSHSQLEHVSVTNSILSINTVVVQVYLQMAYLYPLLTPIARTSHTFLNVKSVCLKAAMSFLELY